MLSAQAQTTKIVTTKNLSQQLRCSKTPVVEGIFATISTTKGDITTQLEFENTCYGCILFVEGKTLC
jgi:hypothetical protein